jgi:hypothetical protein
VTTGGGGEGVVGGGEEGGFLGGDFGLVSGGVGSSEASSRVPVDDESAGVEVAAGAPPLGGADVGLPLVAGSGCAVGVVVGLGLGLGLEAGFGSGAGFGRGFGVGLRDCWDEEVFVAGSGLAAGAGVETRVERVAGTILETSCPPPLESGVWVERVETRTGRCACRADATTRGRAAASGGRLAGRAIATRGADEAAGGGGVGCAGPAVTDSEFVVCSAGRAAR